MKLTKSTLKQLIKEELQNMLSEATYPMKKGQDAKAQRNQRKQINAACFGAQRGVPKRELASLKSAFAQNSKVRCEKGAKIPYKVWRGARRANWRGNTEKAAAILAKAMAPRKAGTHRVPPGDRPQPHQGSNVPKGQTQYPAGGRSRTPKASPEEQAAFVKAGQLSVQYSKNWAAGSRPPNWERMKSAYQQQCKRKPKTVYKTASVGGKEPLMPVSCVEMFGGVGVRK